MAFKVRISEANSNGTLQVTIPMRAAEQLGWTAGKELTPVILSGKKNGEKVPFALVFHVPEGTNGICLKKKEDNDGSYFFEYELT